MSTPSATTVLVPVTIPAFQTSVVKPVETIGCSSAGCTSAPTVQWQRHGTQAEYDTAMATQLAPNDGVLKISVFACATHALSADEMAYTHQADCPWTAACSCAATDAAPAYTEPATTS